MNRIRRLFRGQTMIHNYRKPFVIKHGVTICKSGTKSTARVESFVDMAPARISADSTPGPGYFKQAQLPSQQTGLSEGLPP